MPFKPQPATGGGGGAAKPAIVQMGINVGASISNATLGAPPANGNLLIAITSTPSGVASAGAGWNLFSSISGPGGVFGANQPGIFWKIAGASESATQTPWNGANAGVIAIYELTGASPSIWTQALNQTNTTQAISVNAFKVGGLILGLAFNRTDVTLASSITGVTLDTSATGGGFSGQGFHILSPVKGLNTATVTWAASKNFDFYMLNMF